LLAKVRLQFSPALGALALSVSGDESFLMAILLRLLSVCALALVDDALLQI
jgi:hypothetical protein